MAWHCPNCGHHHGTQACGAITETENGGARKCGCHNHNRQEAA